MPLMEKIKATLGWGGEKTEFVPPTMTELPEASAALQKQLDDQDKAWDERMAVKGAERMEPLPGAAEVKRQLGGVSWPTGTTAKQEDGKEDADDDET